MKLMPLLLLPSLFSPFVIAQPTCTVNSFQAINIEPTIEAAKYDEKSQTAEIHHQPPIRCASITFQTAHTLNKVVNAMHDEFEVTYADMTTTQSHLIKFSDDAVDSGYIQLRRHKPQTAYACFSTSSTPITSITCKFE
ncbi:hypothetical protein [Photobacterium kishitanii]|uniref:Uncharacterized protein n=1 Tax=Photobacterium kishitanii TaxID=318456 RepID=A0A2T3KF95_9GAMM|nr:hypothetical protein [Photobacterium kishitanii]PSU87675.1 hypothetical protein C0W42_15310 [Photobacterium kishitanii]PSU96546.1 hypothetical protein C9J27_16530 [Photobacterium kishitanii]